VPVGAFAEVVGTMQSEEVHKLWTLSSSAEGLVLARGFFLTIIRDQLPSYSLILRQLDNVQCQNLEGSAGLLSAAHVLASCKTFA